MHRAARIAIVLATVMSGVVPAAGQAVEDRFRSLDADGDGVLSREEFPRARLFDRLDADGDGKLSLKEASAFARRATPDLPPASNTAPVAPSHADVVYAQREDSDPRLTSLDIYLPEDPKGERVPVVVYVHGGAWRMGDKTRVQAKPAHYTAKGWALVSVNYRLSPAVRHPAHAEDVAAAVAFVIDHAEDYGFDPELVAIMGHSAGAHLAMLVATDGTLLKAHGLDLHALRGAVSLDTASQDIEQASQRPGTARMIAEAFGDDPEVLRDASPIRQLNEGKAVPPMLLVYASERRNAAASNISMHERAQELGLDSALLAADGKDHAAVNRDVGVDGDAMSDTIDAFLERAFRK